MDVFISWAGTRSLAAAEALKDWIPMLINAVRPWLSKAHIPSGRLWRTELAESLSSCKFGIFCLTPTSLQSNWMFFEAGAISKTLEDAYVCPLLIDLKLSDVKSPFADFQCRIANKEGLLALMETLNKALPPGTTVPEAQMHTVFELLWPQLELKLAGLPPDKDGENTHEARPATEILEEILSRVRAIEQRGPSALSLVAPESASSLPLNASGSEILRRNRARLLLSRLHTEFPDLTPRVSTQGMVILRDPNGKVLLSWQVPLNVPFHGLVRAIRAQLEDAGYRAVPEAAEANPAQGADLAAHEK